MDGLHGKYITTPKFGQCVLGNLNSWRSIHIPKNWIQKDLSHWFVQQIIENRLEYEKAVRGTRLNKSIRIDKHSLVISYINNII